MKHGLVAGFAAPLALLIAGCSGEGQTEQPSISVPPPDQSSNTATAENHSLMTIAPVFIGMLWPEAQARGAAAGLNVTPVMTGPPGPLRPECFVIEQTPSPGVELTAPVVTLMLTCPPLPGPDQPTAPPLPPPPSPME
jgi:hypothetical protein